jgi:hypothetical protein
MARERFSQASAPREQVQSHNLLIPWALLRGDRFSVRKAPQRWGL